MTSPVAVDSNLIISTSTANGTVEGTLTGSDAEGPVTFALFGDAGSGDVIVHSDGTFSYTPDAEFTGSDSFTFTVAQDSESATATVHITVTDNVMNTVEGTAGNDVLIGGTKKNSLYGYGGDDHLVGGLGGDRIYGGDGNDVIETSAGNGKAYGEGGSDVLLGDTGHQELNGGAGDDYLDGGAGNDKLVGGTGDDRYVIDADGDAIIELANEGTDTVLALVSYTLGANLENLTLTGTANLSGTGNGLANLIIGNSGNNVLDGGAGADTLVGGEGDDTYVVEDPADVVTELGGQGTDTVQASVTQTLGDNVENLILTGTGNIDGTGNELNNSITGNSGNNTLNGGGGADTLDGGAGSDTLNGGDGDDAAVFSGLVSDYTVTQNADGSISVTQISTGDIDHLTSVEHLSFAGSVQLSVPKLAEALLDQSVAEDKAWTFQVPSGTFEHSSTLTYSATLGDGTALPSWLSFDPTSGSFSGTPPQDFNGTLSLKVTAWDGALSASSTFDLDVSPVNDGPALTGTQATLAAGPEDTVYTVSKAQLLAGYTDVDGDTLAVSEVTADHGTVTANSDGTYTITPSANYNGAVSLSYTVVDGQGGSAPASRGFTLAAANDGPTGLSLDTTLVAEFAAKDTAVGTLSASDVDSSDLTYALLDDAGGRFALVGHQIVVADGLRLDFEQQATHTIQVQVTDDQGEVSTESFTITLTDVAPEIITGDARANTLVAGLGSDVLKGGSGDDTLLGGAGRDRLAGGADQDILKGGSDNDVLLGNDGNDALGGGRGWDKLFGGTGRDQILGGMGNDVLKGGLGNDTLVGGLGRDTLVGGMGRDSLLGGQGKDTLTGGDGADHFVFTRVSASGPDQARWDVITDFGGRDKIDLHAVDAVRGQKGNQDFHLDLDGSFSAGEIRSTERAGGTLVEINVDSDARAEMAIYLKGFHGHLNNGDFVF